MKFFSPIRWKSVDGREPLQQAVKLLFPTVQTTVSNLVNQQSEEAAEMLKLALKSYYGAIQASFAFVLGRDGETVSLLLHRIISLTTMLHPLVGLS